MYVCIVSGMILRNTGCRLTSDREKTKTYLYYTKGLHNLHSS